MTNIFERLLLVKVVILACFVLSACSLSNQNQPLAQYYLFDANPSRLVVKPHATAIKINRINLPLYLNTSNLIMLDGESGIIPANFHLWADSLDRSIERALINDLNLLNNEFQFVSDCQECSSLTLTIDHFYPTSTGKVLLAGRYVFEGSTGALPFFIENRLEAAGYEHAVAAMRKQIKALAVDITATLSVVKKDETN